jgi:Tat protein translocase TatB subunit
VFGSLGGSEVLLILALALLLFGPRRLPEIGRQIGRTLSQFRRAANDFAMDLEREVRTEELKRELSQPVSADRGDGGPVQRTDGQPTAER